MKHGIPGYLAFLFFFFPIASFSQEGAIKLAEGVYAIKGPGGAMNTGFVVGDRGVFVFSCDLPDYDRRMQAIRSVAGGKPVRFVADLLFVELNPTADGRSDVGNWQRVLKTLAGWSPASVVPGHGEFAPGNGAKPLLDQDRYFETMRNQVRAMRDAGKSVDEIKNGIRAELGEFAQWPRERAVPATAEQVYRELSAK